MLLFMKICISTGLSYNVITKDFLFSMTRVSSTQQFDDLNRFKLFVNIIETVTFLCSCNQLSFALLIIKKTYGFYIYFDLL